MPELTFVTGNLDKFTIAARTGAAHGITVVQISPDIDEVQGEDAEYIARKKAATAFEVIGKPVVISDDSWTIPELNGFPGPYMKSMNHYLSAADFLRLCSQLSDRTCFLNQILVYQDAAEQIVFSNQVKGTILTEPHGETSIPWAALAALDGDSGLSVAEVRDGEHNNPQRSAANVWHELFRWYTEHRV